LTEWLEILTTETWNLQLCRYLSQAVWQKSVHVLCTVFVCMMYRHEKPTDPDDPLADQNIKDRFFGINDPVADKLMRRYDSMPKLDVPEDKLVTTLYIGNLADRVSEKDLRYVGCHSCLISTATLGIL